MTTRPQFPIPAYPADRRSHMQRFAPLYVLIAGASIAGMIFVVSFLVFPGSSSSPTPAPSAAAAAESVVPPPAEPVIEAPPEPPPGPQDFTIDLKTLSKQCYGYGVGCDVEVEPEIGWAVDLNSLSCDLTYEITGDETGPVIETAYTSGDEYEFMPSMLSTRSHSTEVTVEITEVDCR